MVKKDFLDIIDWSADELLALVAQAAVMKKAVNQGRAPSQKNHRHHHWVGIFEKPSTRTRISFQLALDYLGGHFLPISGGEMQLGKGESLADTAQVLSQMAAGIMIRTYDHQTLKILAANATIPVINGLTDHSHPCQIMAGLLTLTEEFGGLAGLKLAWIGDGNNTCQSWVEAAQLLGLNMAVATPRGYELPPLPTTPKNISFGHDPKVAAAGRQVIITDTWVSMNHSDRAERLKNFHGFTIDESLMALADKKAILSHCLPAHRGEEVTAGVIDGPQSRVWREAENRIYAQMAIVDQLTISRA